MPAPVHRLGRGTSGVLICACSEQVRAATASGRLDTNVPLGECQLALLH